MPLDKTSKIFLQSIFGTKAAQATVEWWRFDQTTGKAVNIQAARAVAATPGEFDSVYWSVGMMAAGTGRGNANVEAVHALVADDVGIKVSRELVDFFMPEPTQVVESSPGSFQYVWAVPAGMTVAQHHRLRAGLEALLGVRLDGSDPSRLFRVPMGVNGKNEPDKAGFPVTRVGGSGKGFTYDELDALLPLAGIVISRAQTLQQGHVAQKATLAEIRTVLFCIDNSNVDLVGYDDWINAGIAAYGAGGDEVEEMWLEWSYLSPLAGKKFLPEDKWKTFPAEPYAGFGALERIAKRLMGVGALAAAFFDDGAEPPPDDEDEEPTSAAFALKGGAALPRRPWVYGKRLVRGYVSTTVAAGGVGKSSLTMVEALAMATGRDLLGVGGDKMPRAPARVWIWNGEDPLEEMELRLEAACQHYGIGNGDLGGRLWVDSGRDKPIKLAVPSGKSGVVVNENLVQRIIRRIKRDRVDVLVVDPLVSAHYVNENDNMQMDVVIKTLGRIAGECGCAVDIVHHTRKGNGEEASVDDARGAGAVINAARHLRVLTQMTRSVGEKHGIMDYRSYFSISKDAVKANLSPPLDSDRWFRMVSVDMGNGDLFPADGGLPEESEKVGVCESWTLTIANIDRGDMVEKAHRLMAGRVWRYNEQTGPDWVGNPVGEALGVDITQGKAARTGVKEAIEKWLREGWLRKVQGQRGNRQTVTYVEKGNDPSPAF